MDIPSTKLPLKTGTTKQAGDAAEGEALRHLQLNYRSMGRSGGEIDLIMATPDGTTVFVEVRSRASSARWRGCQYQFLQATAHCFCCAPLPEPSASHVAVLLRCGAGGAVGRAMAAGGV
jgi:hypothetical protein